MGFRLPYERCWWVEPGRVLAGGYPGGRDEGDTRQRLEALLEVGMEVFICLQEFSEVSKHGEVFIDYLPILHELAEERGVEICRYHYPVRDMGVPSVEMMVEILARIWEGFRLGRGVFIHCWGGHGRAGTVVGCWLVERGYSGEEALERIVQLRLHDPHLYLISSPQTQEQREMVLKWSFLRRSWGGEV